MSRYCGCHKVVVMLLAAALTLASMIGSPCRLALAAGRGRDRGDRQRLEIMKSIIELSSRNDIVEMAGYGEEKLSNVLITGTIGCDEVCLTDSHGHHQLSRHPISGALVGATCQNNNIKEKRVTWAKAVTDEYGDFIIDLPSHLHAIPNMDKACSVKVLQLPKNSPCRQSTLLLGKHKGIKLSSLEDGIRKYTAERITFLRHSEACMKGREQEVSW